MAGLELGLLHGKNSLEGLASTVARSEVVDPDTAHKLLGQFLIKGIQIKRTQYIVERDPQTLENLEYFLRKAENARKGEYIGAKVAAWTVSEELIDPAFGNVTKSDRVLSAALEKASQQAPDFGKPLEDLIKLPRNIFPAKKT